VEEKESIGSSGSSKKGKPALGRPGSRKGRSKDRRGTPGGGVVVELEVAQIQVKQGDGFPSPLYLCTCVTERKESKEGKEGDLHGNTSAKSPPSSVSHLLLLPLLLPLLPLLLQLPLILPLLPFRPLPPYTETFIKEA